MLEDEIEKIKIKPGPTIKNNGKFDDNYKMQTLIGKGSVAEVKKCVSNQGITRAVKIVKKNTLTNVQL